MMYLGMILNLSSSLVRVVRNNVSISDYDDDKHDNNSVIAIVEYLCLVA